MDLSKAQLLLEKINRLYKSMSLDPENVAQIEKDLMRDYIKLLYGSFLEDPINTPPPPVKRKSAPPPRIEPKRTMPVQASPPTVEERIFTPPPVTTRIIAPPPVEEVIVETPPPAPIHQPRASSTPSKPSFASNQEEDQLFSLENGSELSHKLSSLPISDLNKAMGINERIFTINELFRGDSRAFKHTMNELNQVATFKEAKAYLMENIVTAFDWTNKQRRNKAKNFIKLVRRRYI